MDADLNPETGVGAQSPERDINHCIGAEKSICTAYRKVNVHCALHIIDYHAMDADMKLELAGGGAEKDNLKDY